MAETVDFNVVDRFLVEFSNAIDTAFGLISPDVSWLTGTLLTISVVMFGITWALRADNMTPQAIRKILTVGFFLFLITQWAELSDIVMNGFVTLGLKAGASSLTASQFMTPTNVFIPGYDLAWGLFQEASRYDPVFGNTFNFALFMITGLVVIVAFIVIAIQVFMTILQFKLGVLAALVMLPFGMLKQTAFIAEKPLGWVISSGIRLFVLALVVSLGLEVVNAYLPSAPPGGTVEYAGPDDALATAFASIVLCLLAWNAPQLAADLISGAPSLGAGTAVGGAIAGAAGGAAAIGAATGAVGAAAKNPGKTAALAAAGAGAAMTGGASAAPAIGGGAAAKAISAFKGASPGGSDKGPGGMSMSKIKAAGEAGQAARSKGAAPSGSGAPAAGGAGAAASGGQTSAKAGQSETAAAASAGPSTSSSGGGSNESSSSPGAGASDSSGGGMSPAGEAAAGGGDVLKYGDPGGGSSAGSATGGGSTDAASESAAEPIYSGQSASEGGDVLKYGDPDGGTSAGSATGGSSEGGNENAAQNGSGGPWGESGGGGADNRRSDETASQAKSGGSAASSSATAETGDKSSADRSGSAFAAGGAPASDSSAAPRGQQADFQKSENKQPPVKRESKLANARRHMKEAQPEGGDGQGGGLNATIGGDED